MAHTFGEAFRLMKYLCKCGHREVIWNSRDGITPFTLGCPSCGQPSLSHQDWKSDIYAPEHKPHHGQRYWRDLTWDEAMAWAKRRIEQVSAAGFDNPPPVEELAKNFYDDGHQPAIAIAGYELPPEVIKVVKEFKLCDTCALDAEACCNPNMQAAKRALGSST